MGVDDLQRVLDDTVRVWGEDHPRSLVARKDLARAYFEARDYYQAFLLQDQLLAGVTRLFGAEHRTTVDVLTNLASIWFSGWLTEGRPELAIPLYELAVAERVRITGLRDPGTLSARNDLAVAYLTAGQFLRAAAVFEHVLVDCVDVLGESHSLTQHVRDALKSFAGVYDVLAVAPAQEQRDAAMTQEIVSGLVEVLGLAPTVSGGRVSVDLPAIGETLSLLACDVKRVTRSFTPMGDAALEFVMIENGDVRLLIVLADNVVFAPEDPVEVLMAPIPVVISNAPPLTSYVEMVADAERFARSAMSPDGRADRQVTGSCLLLRCIITAAVRFGLRPLRAVAWWQRGWLAGGVGWDLPPFPPDPVWDHLARSAAGLALTPSVVEDRVDIRTAVAALTVADFRELEPRLSVAQLDEEFVTIWKMLIPIMPARFADLLMDRLSGARADLTLYPGGAGSADLILRDNGEPRAVVQLRFDLRTGDLRIDELRIAEAARGKGLLQRLQYNVEQLATALGLRAIRIMATGVGSYAFAVSVFPRDKELYDKVHRKAPPSTA